MDIEEGRECLNSKMNKREKLGNGMELEGKRK